MKASEVIQQLAEAIAKHGDIPVVAFCSRAEGYVEAGNVYMREEESYQAEDMKKRTSTVVEIDYR